MSIELFREFGVAPAQVVKVGAELGALSGFQHQFRQPIGGSAKIPARLHLHVVHHRIVDAALLFSGLAEVVVGLVGARVETEQALEIFPRALQVVELTLDERHGEQQVRVFRCRVQQYLELSFRLCHVGLGQQAGILQPQSTVVRLDVQRLGYPVKGALALTHIQPEFGVHDHGLGLVRVLPENRLQFCQGGVAAPECFQHEHLGKAQLGVIREPGLEFPGSHQQIQPGVLVQFFVAPQQRCEIGEPSRLDDGLHLGEGFSGAAVACEQVGQ